MHLPFWLTVAALSPAIAPLAVYTRHTTPRLPEAEGHRAGHHGGGSAGYRLLVLGESTAAGVGVPEHQQGLASQIARLLAHKSRRRVDWQTMGTNGIRMAALLDQVHNATLPEYDAVFVSMGVNDTTGLTPRKRYRQQLARLIQLIQHQQPDVAIYLLSVPPMHQFTALPSPLRQILGWRARLLDGQHQQLASTTDNVFYLGYPPLCDPALLAEDGYHPSANGYLAMAEAIARQL